MVMLNNMKKCGWFLRHMVFGLTIISVVGAAFAVLHPQDAQAATCYVTDFFCPRSGTSDGDYLRYDGAVTITGQNLDGPGGNHQNPSLLDRNDFGSNTGAAVSAGDRIKLTVTYRPSHLGTNATVWINGDLINNDSLNPPTGGCGQNGQFSNSSGTPYSSTQNNHNCGSDGYSSSSSAEKANNCPSFYTANPTNYPGASNAQSGKTWPASPGDTPPGNNYVSTCAYTGISKVWKGAGVLAGNTYTYSTVFTVNNDNTIGQRMCFMAQVSDSSPVYGQTAQSGPAISHMKSRSLKKACIKPATITATGHVQTTDYNNSSTGRPFANTTTSGGNRSPIAWKYHKNSNWEYVSTDANGNFSIPNVYSGVRIDIRGDSPYTFNGAGNADFKGTGNVYKLIGGGGATSYSPRCYSDTDCTGFAFTYDPQPTHPDIGKVISSISNNTCTMTPGCVSPGARIDYTILAVNSSDANLKDVTIDDPIPLNMSPGSVVIDRVQYDAYSPPNGSRPGNNGNNSTWAVSSTTGTCLNTNNNTFTYGYPNQGRTTTSRFQCGQHRMSWVGNQAVFTHFDVMPAYSILTIKLHGTVKSAPNVGVYPMWNTYATCADNGYFPGGGGTTEGVYGSCVDKTNGFQGVANWADSYTGGSWSYFGITTWQPPGGFPKFSAVQYSPIPGRLACAPGKYADQAHADPTGPGSATICDSTSGATMTKAQNYLYVPERADQNHYNVNLQLFRDTSLGPIDFNFYDQSAGSGLNSPIYTSQPEMSGGTSQVYNSGSRQPVWAGAANGTGNDAQYFNFMAHFDGPGGPGNGGGVTNKASACIIKFWEVGHGLACTDTNTINFKRYRIDNPTINTTNGDVHAGANGGTPTLCPKRGNSNPTTVFNSASTIGDYFVTSIGDLGARSRNLGTPGGTVGVVYKPNMCQSAENYPTSQKINASDAILSGDVEGNKGITDGKLLQETPPSPGFITLGDGSPINIKQRWTLYVKGNLYIRSNIKYPDNPNDPNNHQTVNGVSVEKSHASFGVIVDGNIYVDPGVTRLDGFYVSSGTTNTCSSLNGSGTAKTLAINNDPSGYTVSQCRNALVVGGSLYANSFRFNRTIPQASGVAEQVNFNNLLFTATPPAFNSLKVSSMLSQYLIEPLPRY